jgi:hypothetical protein
MEGIIILALPNVLVIEYIFSKKFNNVSQEVLWKEDPPF